MALKKKATEEERKCTFGLASRGHLFFLFFFFGGGLFYFLLRASRICPSTAFLTETDVNWVRYSFTSERHGPKTW